MNKVALNIVLRFFSELASIPRPSHHEERASEYLYQWAVEHGLAAEKAPMGEIIIDKPASAGCEHIPKVILQAHMDMVCVAEQGICYDPLNDPIHILNDGEYLRADGTSLLADNGISVALCLYLLQDASLRHGPLRAIFTVNEEDGMASSTLDPSYLTGSYLINVDWETSGSLCNSCAGGDFFTFTRWADWQEPPADSKLLRVHLHGLLGGHSGLDINKGRANAVVSIAELLCRLYRSGVPVQLASFNGGRARNAIPNCASAKLVLAASDLDKAEQIIARFHGEFVGAYGNIERNFALDVEVVEQIPERVLSRELSQAFAGLLVCVPNSVHTMSPFVNGLVESSSNPGVASLAAEQVHFSVFARSSVSYQASQLGTICVTLAEQFGFDFEAQGHIPGWAVNPNSHLTDLTCAAYRELTGQDMTVSPVRARLECGAFSEKTQAWT